MKNLTVDAGIVFADKSNYLCWPLERVGIPLHLRITSVSTSCDCATASIVDYKKGLNEISRAVLIVFVQEQNVEAPALNAPALLGIVVNIVTNDGVTRQFTVNVVHTTRLDR